MVQHVKEAVLLMKDSPCAHHHQNHPLLEHHEAVWQVTAEKSLRKHCPYQHPLLTYAEKKTTNEERTKSIRHCL